MPEVPDIRVLVESFRAISSADIVINGITVVAGENSSGKSSISKLLYYLYKTVANYENIVKHTLYYSLKDIIQLLDILVQERSLSENHEPGDLLRREVIELKRGVNGITEIEIGADQVIDLITRVEEAFYDTIASDPNKPTSKRVQRIKYILQDILNTEELDVKESFLKVKEIVKERFAQAKEIIELRPTAVFTSELENVFSEGDLPKKFEVQEYGDPIVSLNKENLSIPYNIQKAIYIDSPMMFHAETSHNIHWDDLTKVLEERGDNNHNIAEIISKEIIKGDILTEESTYSPEDFVFKRSDGAVFNLIDVATGIKSFSILQLLLKNGSITDKTLMIIDEPESNLHPQWIIEYARIIVMLNKQLGVKFFLATHNPDMVSAIRYISEKEGTLEKVNFYLAEKTDDNFKYNYTYLGKEIDPIFASFNIALERINKYGI
ncbi:AAA family ATPase [Chitinophaga sp. LS1]|uniref:AAA family ATPase n=1 Tax=Chitinophaga sp. LS1 TaxID=3051176 RepID=UPI002AAB78FC|nr:AAA family ATPase [Chitinophaga sp. LS1]WPV63753.1 AAA family ATPase [Chitinophaga sp. LS1]